VEVILRAEQVETVQAGDRYDFTGTLIVVPDIGVLAAPGARAETNARHKAGETSSEGVRGLKALGVRDLNYRMAFLACSVQPTSTRVSNLNYEPISLYRLEFELGKIRVISFGPTGGYSFEMGRELRRDLFFDSVTYRMNVEVNFALQFGGFDQLGEEMSAETMKKHMTNEEWNKIYEMSRDRNLYQNLTTSLFPSVHGNDQVKKGKHSIPRSL